MFILKKSVLVALLKTKLFDISFEQSSPKSQVKSRYNYFNIFQCFSSMYRGFEYHYVVSKVVVVAGRAHFLSSQQELTFSPIHMGSWVDSNWQWSQSTVYFLFDESIPLFLRCHWWWWQVFIVWGSYFSQLYYFL